jgi:AsmA protein
MSGNARRRFGILKIIAIVVVLIVAVILALPFILDVNQFRPQLDAKLTDALGRKVSVGNLKLSILSGSVSVDDIVVADNPAFSHSPFVTAKSLNVSVELKPLIFSKEIRVTGITLDHPVIKLIRSSSGKWNFSDLGSKTGTDSPEIPSTSGNLSDTKAFVKELKITGGQVTIAEGNKKPSIYDDVNITANNLSFTTAFPFSIAASLPGGGQFDLNGQAGPLDKSDILKTPMKAAIAITHFDLVASGFADPEAGLSGLFDFSGTATSDGRQAKSEGYANADKLQVVKGGAPAAKPASMEYRINYDLAQRRGTIRDVKVQYGKAAALLNGNYRIEGDNLDLAMKLKGTDMPVQDLTTLLPAFGVTLPKGASLKGGSLNVDLSAEGPVNKLVIDGVADISKTRLVGFDLGGKMAALAALAGIESNEQTEIEKFTSRMRWTSDGIQVSDLLLIMPALGELSGAGNITPDQSLDFTMLAKLKPSAGAGVLLNRLTGGSLSIPFFVRGKASDPKFILDTKNVSRSLLGSAFTNRGSKEGQSGGNDGLEEAIRGLFKKKK